MEPPGVAPVTDLMEPLNSAGKSPGDFQPAVDPMTNWIVAHYARPLLLLAGTDPGSVVRAGHPRMSQTSRTPDSLAEWNFDERGVPRSRRLLEIATYGETRIVQQVLDDLALSWLTFRKLLSTVVYVLQPHSEEGLATEATLTSDEGDTRLHAEWRVIKVFDMDVEEIFAFEEAGLAPFAFFARSHLSPEELGRRSGRWWISRKRERGGRACLGSVSSWPNASIMIRSSLRRWEARG